ncbi:5'-deoxynucleotidase [Acetonema longum]|uniref:Metal dependent phosphohydrolase n=1 Tax=Acetonema longum DSM 6540 TaxID=1009370 RepID=F7NJA6_9FIRM|nr:5'-deoxynucleotidase [Acetonema longum]EGO63854.1 metal dependent phosphohydrolase [Acetonema longum DSM 6540]
MKTSHFFAYLSRMRFIQRWGLMRNTTPENIQEHSLQAAMIAHGLAVIRNAHFGGKIDPARAATLAMFHEVSEVFTGDLPTPVKYFNSQIKAVYGNIEHLAKEKLHSMLPPGMAAVYEPLLFPQTAEADLWQIVKAADKLCAYLKCVEELKAGNQEFAAAAKSVLAELDAMGLPEIQYFIQVFAPSFSLSLDELN